MTITAQTAVGALVAARPSRSRVLEKLQIDYCCGGKLSLAEACRKRGLDPQVVVQELSVADEVEAAGPVLVDAAAMGLGELADHIEQAHHACLRQELPRLDAMTERVFMVHGDAEPRLGDVREAFCALRDELVSHMGKEELILFPMIRAMERGESPAPNGPGSLQGPGEEMEREHDAAGDALATIRSATDSTKPTAWGSRPYCAMLG